MKIAFSSIACPTWDLETIIQNASAFGFDGVELRGLQGQLHLPVAAELMSDPDATRGRFADAGLSLICLSSSACFHSRDPQVVAENKAQVREYIDAAAAVGCPYVRVFGAELPRRIFFGAERRDTVLVRIGSALRELAPYAESRGVTILLENSGDFCGSADLWFMVDSAESSAVQACWNTLNGRLANERPTISIPRLGRKIRVLHACDADFDDRGNVTNYVPLGAGSCEIGRMFELLKGTGFDGWFTFDWPKLWNADLKDADKALPEAAEYMRNLLAQKQIVLTAYKNDKNAAKYRARDGAPAA